MNSLEIDGGYSLKGVINPQGAKNEALQVICSVLLTNEKVVIENIPEILDVNKLINLLEILGVKTKKIKQNKFSFQSDNVNLNKIKSDEFIKKATSLRGSVMIVGPLLTRFGKASIPRPGGDKIGRRRLDTHFDGLIKLGAKFNYNSDNYFYNVSSKKLKGNNILLEEASVTGTANILMAAVLASGKTELYNSACEPYIQQLCLLLNKMGAKISGIGSNLLIVESFS